VSGVVVIESPPTPACGGGTFPHFVGDYSPALGPLCLPSLGGGLLLVLSRGVCFIVFGDDGVRGVWDARAR
jgi:hypothetical protein